MASNDGAATFVAVGDIGPLRDDAEVLFEPTRGFEASEHRPGRAPVRLRTFYEQRDWQPGTPPRIVTICYAEDVEAMVADIAAPVPISSSGNTLPVQHRCLRSRASPPPGPRYRARGADQAVPADDRSEVGAVLVPGRLAEDRPRALPVLGSGRRTRRLRPAWINPQAQTELLSPQNPRYTEVLDYLRYLTDYYSLNAVFKTDGDEIVVQQL